MFSVARSEANSIDLRRVPLVFIPGLMGTRLSLRVPQDDQGTEEKVDWDPDRTVMMGGTWGRFTESVVKGKRLHVTTSATILRDAAGLTADETRRGWGTVVASFYWPMLRALEKGLQGSAQECPVYAFGYDWRQSNQTSGEALAVFIGEVLAHERAKEVVAITHSMGGIVLRSAIRKVDVRRKVAGVVHIAQPVLGAPVAYRRLVVGTTDGADDRGMRALLGDASDVANILRGIPGAMELLPHDARSSPAVRGHNRWLFTYSPDEPNARDTLPGSDTIAWYRSVHVPPGVIDSSSPVADELFERLREALRFNKQLKVAHHPLTRAILGDGLTTDTAAVLALTKDGIKGATLDLAACRTDEGDATVPTWSAEALFPGERHPLTKNADPELQQQWVVRGAKHDEICSNGAVIEATVSIIDAILHPPRLGRTGVRSAGAAAWVTITKALAGDRSAQIELRVAKLLAQEGHSVTIAANPDTEKSPDLHTDFGDVEVKLAEGTGDQIEGRVTHGLIQIDGNGTVILVRGHEAIEPLDVYERAARSAIEAWIGRDPTSSPRHRVIDESRLPALWDSFPGGGS